MPEVPGKKKPGRPRLYETKEAKPRRDVASRRMRRRAAAARQNSTRFQTHTAEQVRAVPLSNPHGTHLQSLTSPKLPVDATTSRVPTPQPRQFRDSLHETTVYSWNPITPSSNSHTLFVRGLPSSHHWSLVPKEIFPAVRPYQSIYANLNPPQLTSLGSQSANEPTEEDVANCFDNDDEISPPLDLSPIRDTTPDEYSNSVAVTEQPTGLVDKDTDERG
jgi:hypothetical protein